MGGGGIQPQKNVRREGGLKKNDVGREGGMSDIYTVYAYQIFKNSVRREEGSEKNVVGREGGGNLKVYAAPPYNKKWNSP